MKWRARGMTEAIIISTDLLVDIAADIAALEECDRLWPPGREEEGAVTREYEVTIAGDTVRAIVEVDGRWLPATWGYYGGSPPETPDVEIVRAWRCVTNEETGEAPEIEIDPRELTDAEHDALTDVALTLDARDDDEREPEPASFVAAIE